MKTIEQLAIDMLNEIGNGTLSDEFQHKVIRLCEHILNRRATPAPSKCDHSFVGKDMLCKKCGQYFPETNLDDDEPAPAKLENVLRYVVESKESLSRIKQVCEMTLKGVDVTDVLRLSPAPAPRVPDKDTRVSDALEAVRLELERAMRMHGAFHSHHEGYAALLEEVDELWDAVKNDDIKQARHEAVHVGAMAIRFLHDIICGECQPPKE